MIKDNELENYQYKNRKFSGWRSPHSSNAYGPPEAWSTALVFDAINCMKKKVTSDLNKEIITLYGGKFVNTQREIENNTIKREIPFPHESIKLDQLDNYYSIDGRLQHKKFGHYLMDEIVNKMIDFESGYFRDTSNKYNNAIMLYGPPGTGKTTLTRLIANELHWSYVRIDTATLLQQGMDKALSSIDQIFKHLMNLEQTVILFDEIDECIKQRTAVSGNIENRVLTNSMLTKLNDLKTNKKILYFVNTNYYEDIDKAIKRKGRFDLNIHIGLSKELFNISIKNIVKKFIPFDTVNFQNMDNKYDGYIDNPALIKVLEGLKESNYIINESDLESILSRIDLMSLDNDMIPYLSEENWEILIKGILEIYVKLISTKTSSIKSINNFIDVWRPLKIKIAKIEAKEKQDDISI